MSKNQVWTRNIQPKKKRTPVTISFHFPPGTLGSFHQPTPWIHVWAILTDPSSTGTRGMHRHNLPTSDSPWKRGCIEMVLASKDYLNTPLCNFLPNLVLSNVLAQDRNLFLQVYTVVKL